MERVIGTTVVINKQIDNIIQKELFNVEKKDIEKLINKLDTFEIEIEELFRKYKLENSYNIFNYSVLRILTTYIGYLKEKME